MKKAFGVLVLLGMIVCVLPPVTSSATVMTFGTPGPTPTPSPTPTPTPTPTPPPQASPSPVPTATTLPNYHYIATTGSDSNTGQLTSPFATAQKCATVATAGQHCVFLSGTYTASGTYSAVLPTSGTSGNPIVFQAQTVLGAILDGNSNAACASFDFNDTVSYITIQGFVIQHFACAGINANGGSDGSTKANNFVTITWNHITNNNGNGMRVGQFSHDITISYNEIDHSGNTATCNASQIHGLYISGHDYLISANIFHDNDCGWDIQQAWEVGETNVLNYLIENNTFGVHNNLSPGSNIGNIVIYKNSGLTASGTLANNIFMSSGQGSPFACYQTATSGNPVWLLANNLVGSSSPLTDCTGGTFTQTNNILNQNPQFVSSSPTIATDYKLKGTSPAIGTGMYLSGGVPYDFLGFQYNNPPTIGGFEYPQ